MGLYYIDMQLSGSEHMLTYVTSTCCVTKLGKFQISDLLMFVQLRITHSIRCLIIIVVIKKAGFPWKGGVKINPVLCKAHPST